MIQYCSMRQHIKTPSVLPPSAHRVFHARPMLFCDTVATKTQQHLEQWHLQHPRGVFKLVPSFLLELGRISTIEHYGTIFSPGEAFQNGQGLPQGFPVGLLIAFEKAVSSSSATNLCLR